MMDLKDSEKNNRVNSAKKILMQSIDEMVLFLMK